MAKINRPARVGIIGLGRVACLLEDDPLRAKPCTHLGAWSAQRGVRVVAGCDIAAPRRDEFQRRVCGVRVYDDYQTMLAQEDLDFVSICAYATERCDMVVASARAGVKGIWCEKALATSLPEVARMERALKKHGAILIESYPRRWSPVYHHLHELVNDNLIGTVQTANVHFSGNYFHTGTHAFDLLRWFLGEATTVQAWLEHKVTPRSAVGGENNSQLADWGGDSIVTFRNGARAMIHGRARNYFRFELEFLGTDGMLRIGNTTAELWRRDVSRFHTGIQELSLQPFPVIKDRNMWRDACANLVAAVRGEKDVACGIADGKAAVAMALAAHASHQRGNIPVSVKEKFGDLRVPSR